ESGARCTDAPKHSLPPEAPGGRRHGQYSPQSSGTRRGTMPVDDAHGRRREVVVIFDGVELDLDEIPWAGIRGDSRNAVDIVGLPRGTPLRAPGFIGA